jgi:hypothetical protein
MRVQNTRVNLLGEDHIATGEAKYTLGLLHLVRDNLLLTTASLCHIGHHI